MPEFRLLPPYPLRLLRRQRHLRRHLDAHALVVVEHLLRGHTAGFEHDFRHLRNFAGSSLLKAVGGKHGLEFFE